MRPALLLAALLTAACTAKPEPAPETTPAPDVQAPPEAPADAPKAVDAPKTDDASKTADAAPPREGTIRARLGAPRAAMIASATDVKIARLRVIGARQAQDRRLADAATIAGYPIEGELRALDEATRRRVVDLLLEDSNYDWELARRCGNDFLVGLRLREGDATVEFALGMPCEQAFFVYAEGDAITSFGGLMISDAARVLVDAAPGG
ncbi:MAG: hypothetical protein R3B09_26500 [Nannocystaceae bacterium]